MPSDTRSAVRRSSRLLSLLGLVLVVVVVLGCDATDAGEPNGDALRVLFVGNSLTYTNDLPYVVARLGALHAQPVEVETIAQPNYSLEDHWLVRTAEARLREGDWDVVVMQQGPSTAPASRAHLAEWAGRFADAAREVGTRPALYMVWPSRGSALQATIDSYSGAAEASGAQLMPAGRAWKEALGRAPSLPLYGTDGFHPSPLGTFLAALTIHAALVGDVPDALPETMEVGGETIRLHDGLQQVLLGAVRDAL